MSKSRKFLSVLLSLLMLMTLADIPSLGLKAYAAATEYDLWVNNEQITSDHLTVTCGSGTAVYDPAANTLTLDGAEIDTGCEQDWMDAGILSRLDNLTVVVASDSSIAGPYGDGIDTREFITGIDEDGNPTYDMVYHDLTVKGSGTFTIDSGSGIINGRNVIIDGASLDIKQLFADKNMTITDSDISINSGSYGIVCVNGTLTVTNSDIDITSKGSCIELGNAFDTALTPTMIMNSGSLKLNSSGTATTIPDMSGNTSPMPGYGIEFTIADPHMTINGGKLDITTIGPDGSEYVGTNIPAANIELGPDVNITEGASLQSGGHVVVEKTYTVTYDGNGAASGTAPTDSTKYPSGAAVTVPGNTGSLAKTGYVFDGWNTKANGSGTSYAAGGTFNISDDTKLYAKWTAHTSHTFAATGAADNNDGTHSKTCTVCNAVVKEDHSVPVMMNNNDGTHGGICTDCGAAVKTAHTYGEYTYLNPLGGGDPSLTEHHRLCSVCFAEEVSAHVKDKGTVTKEPTKTEEGERVYKCTLCGLPIETEVIPVLTETTYTVTVTGGTADKTAAAEGETVTVTATVPEGKKFRSWTVKSGGIKLANTAETSFTMPAADVTITAVFEDTAAPSVPSEPSYPSYPGTPATPTTPTTPKEPEKSAIKVTKQSANGASLEWTAVEGADGYVVEKLNSKGKWERIALVKGGDNTTFDIKNLDPATNYTFRVRSYTAKDGKRYVKKSGKQITVTTNPDKVQKFKAAKITKNSIKLTWKKDRNADGYQLQMYRNGAWTTINIYDKNTVVSRTIKGLKSKTTYKFRIRAYKNDANGKKIYGKYSTITAKTK